MELKFRRKLVRIGGSWFVSVPAHFLKEYNVDTSKEQSFLLLIEEGTKAPKGEIQIEDWEGLNDEREEGSGTED